MSVLIARDMVHEPLYVIVPLQNPWRWKSRFKHVTRAIKHFIDSGAVVVLVETAFNRRDFVFQDSGIDGLDANCGIQGSGFKHKWIGLRSPEELWMKEPMVNIGVQSLPHDWQQVAWLDSDVHFIRPNWVGECIQKLQHYSFLQPFTQARDLAPNYEMLPENYPHANGISFVQSWKDGDIEQNLSGGWKKKPLADLAKLQADVAELTADLKTLAQDLEGDYPYDTRRVFPGLAWACTRKAWDDVGGLPTWGVWGGTDWMVAHALIGKRQGMMHTGLHPDYKNLCTQWADRADKLIRRNVGVMEGAIFHSWHGKKTVRGYGDKHRILAKVQFNPTRHLKNDAQGLPQLHDDGSDEYIVVRDEFRRIALERNEDSIDV
jgi:hypothetical protein